MPTLRGIKAVGMTGEGPVEVASDWVDTDSADEVQSVQKPAACGGQQQAMNAS